MVPVIPSHPPVLCCRCGLPDTTCSTCLGTPTSWHSTRLVCEVPSITFLPARRLWLLMSLSEF